MHICLIFCYSRVRMRGKQMNTTTTLTPRELEVLTLCAGGQSNPEIARGLMISPHTVKAHMCSVLEKLGVPSRVSAVVKAIKLGLIEEQEN